MPPILEPLGIRKKFNHIKTSTVFRPAWEGGQGNGSLGGPIPVKEGHIDASAFIVIPELAVVGFMKQVGIENHRPIFPIRNDHGPGILFLKKIEDPLFIPRIVVFLEIPFLGGHLIPHD